MKANAYIYSLNETLNSKVENDKLSTEIYSAAIPNVFIKMRQVDGDIQVHYETELLPQHLVILQSIIDTHDGQISPYLDVHLMEERRLKVRHLVANADYAGMPIETVVGYRTTIDDEVNGWVDTGVNATLTAKIQADTADVGNAYYAFLNTPLPNGGVVADFFLLAVQ